MQMSGPDNDPQLPYLIWLFIKISTRSWTRIHWKQQQLHS